MPCAAGWPSGQLTPEISLLMAWHGMAMAREMMSIHNASAEKQMNHAN